MKTVVKRFGEVADPLAEGQKLLELYQAQVVSAIRCGGELLPPGEAPPLGWKKEGARRVVSLLLWLHQVLVQEGAGHQVWGLTDWLLPPNLLASYMEAQHFPLPVPLCAAGPACRQVRLPRSKLQVPHWLPPFLRRAWLEGTPLCWIGSWRCCRRLWRSGGRPSRRSRCTRSGWM